MTSFEIVKNAVLALDSKKAEEISVLKVDALTSITDYFVIAAGTSTTQVKALADEVEFRLKEAGLPPHHIEGYTQGNWIVLDFYQVIVHVFNDETRKFYALENLWRDGTPVDIKEFTE
ncbi:MAG TPA: ribosome silencing factor [Ruminococcaceae bacterium]|nr:ribosome silencing factor [Oscillospiraceae bacterium]